MFLAWNYTIELFFWIVLGAVILVSLTILMAGPGFRSKKSETSGETLLLTGESIDSPKENILNQDTASGSVEKELEILEEIEKGETVWTRFRWWVGNIPARMVRWIENILRFLRKEWRTLVVGVGFCFYFLIVCVLGALIAYETLTTYESVEITGEWWGIALETWIFRLAVVFGATVFFTGVISAYSFLIENQKWSRYSCRTTAIVLLLFFAFGLNVGDLNDVYPDDPLDDELWKKWERDLQDAGVMSLYLMFASLLFSGDVKRLWERILSNERIKQLMEKGEFLGIDLRLLLLMGMITLAIGIIIFETEAYWSSF